VTFKRDPFLGLDFFAAEFDRSVKHLQSISLAQRGLWGTRKRGAKKPFSDRCLRQYPTFRKGPGGRIGMWASDYTKWREEIGAPLQKAS
jgi:hypothetical protein